MITLDRIDLKGKTVLVREDLNVPFNETGILSTQRIDAAVQTIRLLQAKEAKIILMSHLGRPTGRDERYTLQPIADYLSNILDQKVPLFGLGDPVPPLQEKSVALLENVRFNDGETENKESLAKQYAALCDVFVMDAFGVSHRAHASTTGVIEFSKEACAGPLLTQEMTQLRKALEYSKPPLVAIVGGAKVSTKLGVLLNLIKKVDTLIVGGALANTFLLAQGKKVGASLVEPQLVSTAKEILLSAEKAGKLICLPQDVVVAPDIESSNIVTKAVDEIADDDKIFDIGPKSIHALRTVIENAQTIVWNGPLGVFEKPIFQAGTKALAEMISNSQAFSIAGGGETIAAIELFNIAQSISYISTGGGAFLEILEGKTLPAWQALEDRAQQANLLSI